MSLKGRRKAASYGGGPSDLGLEVTRKSSGRLVANPRDEAVLEYLRRQVWKADGDRHLHPYRIFRKAAIRACTRLFRQAMDYETNCSCTDDRVCPLCRKLTVLLEVWPKIEKIVFERVSLEATLVTRYIERMGGLAVMETSDIEDSAEVLGAVDRFEEDDSQVVEEDAEEEESADGEEEVVEERAPLDDDDEDRIGASRKYVLGAGAAAPSQHVGSREERVAV